MIDITIVGGGWSVGDIDFSKLVGHVIGVNESGLLLPRVDRIVSMDRKWTEHSWEKIKRLAVPTSLRRSAVQNISGEELDACRLWLDIFECDNETNRFSDTPIRLNGTNSGACAMNLAYQLRPRRLFLLGFDMKRSAKGEAYWYPPYPWAAQKGGTSNGKYVAWSRQFEEAARSFKSVGTDVFNVSPQSAIGAFKKITPAQYAREFK